MRLFGIVDGAVDRSDRAGWLSGPFDLAYSGAVAPAYDTLLAACVAALKAALVPGSLSGVYDEIPPGLALPYATIVEVGNSRRYTDTAGGYVDSGMIQVAVYASGKAAARDLADAVADALDDADLEFAEGTLMLLRQGSRLAGTEPDRAPGGGAIRSETRTYEYMFSSGLS